MRKLEKPPEIMVLASGKASTLEALVRSMQKAKSGYLDPGFSVGLVVSDHPEKTWPTVERLNRDFGLNIQMEEVTKKLYPRGAAKRGITDEESEKICELFESGNFAMTAMLGCMRILRGVFLEKYGWQPDTDKYTARIINTHPGILPATADTYGAGAAQKVLDLGLQKTAHTLHVVSAEVDKGASFWETPVAVQPNDTAETLFRRVQVTEKENILVGVGHFLSELLKRQNTENPK